MLKRKFVEQDGYKNCGPVCLLMIIQHYKGNISIDSLKEMCKTGKNGTSAYHLIEAAKKCGMEAYGIKETIKEDLILPCIAHVVINNSYNHYVVIYKVDFKKRRVLVADPADKIKYFSLDEFNKIFDGVLIIMYPKFNLPNEKETSIWDFMKSIIVLFKSQLIYLILLSLLLTFFAIISTFYFQYMVDNIVSDKNRLLLVFIVFSFIYLLKVLISYVRNKVLIIVNQKIDLYLTCNTFKQIILLKYPYYHNHTTGEILSKITDLKIVREVISKVALSLFIDFPLTIVSLIVLFIINTKLSLIAVIILSFYILILLLFKKSYQKNIKESHRLQESVTSYMVESISGFESIKGCSIEDKVIEKQEKEYLNLSNKLAKFENLYNNQYLIKEIINDGGFLIIVLIGSLLVLNKSMTFGSLLSFNMLLSYFLNPIKEITNLDSNIKEANNAIKRINNLIILEEGNGFIEKKIDGDIKIKNLNYSFDDKVDVLKNINLNIKKGNKVLITGNSGGGKSTLLKILKGYYQVPRDTVYFNEIDINDYKRNDIVYVSQNEMLFTDTIINNIGNKDILKLAKICLVDVSNKPLGYNTLIEENGFNISGGQKQRIVLARALNRQFNIILIDEGLSQVDVNNERVILKNLFKEYKDKTFIIVSHRLDNLDLFDQLIEIREGVKIDATYAN